MKQRIEIAIKLVLPNQETNQHKTEVQAQELADASVLLYRRMIDSLTKGTTFMPIVTSRVMDAWVTEDDE